MISLRKFLYSLVIASFFLSSALAQEKQTALYWIILREPKTVLLNQQSKIEAQSLGISERALKRRAKSHPPDRLIDELDFPVSQKAIKQIKGTGAKIRNISRWFNAISVEATQQQLETLNTLPVVFKSEPVVKLKRSKPKLSPVTPPSLYRKSSASLELNYGFSGTQLSNIKVVNLHSLGVNGNGVLIGMLDDGFNNYRTHASLKNINVVATYDFIHDIEDVDRQPWEIANQGNHGAYTLSVIGGFDSGQLIGAAYGASFLLAKTEMDSSGSDFDFHSEEDTYVAALEWAERLGADITSSSLGYKEFDTLSYTTSQLDGRTTKVAQAAIIAARKGVLVVTAAGNEGDMPSGFHMESTLVSPADADSIIAVGATTSDGELAAFSGCGPTADGRIKPEVVAQGLAVYCADGTTTTEYLSLQGTSLSTPLVAGAAALILSVHPELTAMQVRQALLSTAIPSAFRTSQNAQYPNNYYGYGFIDAFAAAQVYGPIQPVLQQNYPNPFNNAVPTTIVFKLPVQTNVDLAVYNLLGQRIKTLYHGWAFRELFRQWDGTDDFGRRVATGVYFAYLKTPTTVLTKKMLYLK